MTANVDIKVVLLGKHSVGKTALVERYLHGKFKDATVATVGAAFGAKKLTVNGKEVTLGIWDTAGQVQTERYESMSRIYYRSAKATIVCYDLTDGKSFDKVKFWVDEVLNTEEGCDIYIVGTKLDLVHSGTDRGTSQEEVNEYVKSMNAKHFETSAKTGDNIEELFQDIAETHVKKMGADSASSTAYRGAVVQTVTQPQPKEKKCCS